MAIEFEVLGKPAPRGSKSPIPFKKRDGKLGVRVVDSNANSQPWMDAVRYAASQAYRGPLLKGPVNASFYFYFPRPKSHYRTGKNSHLLREGAPKQFHSQKPDLSKLIRCAEDALKLVIWLDDSQVATYSPSCKFWTEGPAKMQVVITELEDE